MTSISDDQTKASGDEPELDAETVADLDADDDADVKGGVSPSVKLDTCRAC